MATFEEREKIRDQNEARIRASLKRYYERHKEQAYNRQKIWRENAKKIIEDRLGTQCYICGSQYKIKYHEISGNSHVVNTNYILNHLNVFLPVCWDCHGYLHRRFKTINIDRLAELVLMLRKV